MLGRIKRNIPRLRYGIVAVFVVVICLPQGVLAISTGETTALPTVPIMITSYQTNSAGTGLDYIELYNSSKSLLRVEDWTVVLVGDSLERSVGLSTDYDGWLEPGSHVVAARDVYVPGASFVLHDDVMGVDNFVIKSFRVDRSGYRSQTATLASNKFTPMVRTYNTDSYSTASSPFVKDYRTLPQPPLFDDGLYLPPVNPGIKIVEIYPYSSSCSPFDGSVLCGDYVKLYNPTNADVDLNDLVLRTDSSSTARTSSNTFELAGTLQPGEYLTVWQTNSGGRISLTNSGGYAWLEDKYGVVAPYPGSAAEYQAAGASLQGFAYAANQAGEWGWTSTPMPGSANIITAPTEVPCPDGKYRNSETNRCRSLEETLNTLATCEEGYERNMTTNRCRKIGSLAAVATLTPCKEGQERNLATNRCRSIASALAELLPCDEGYERNPATNRCRKLRETGVLAAEYPVQPYAQGAATATWWIVGSVGALALGYAIWEWRREIAAAAARLRAAITPGRS